MKLKEIFSSLLSRALIISVIPFNTYGANIELQNTGDLQTTDLTSACEFKLKEDDTYEIIGHEGFIGNDVITEGWVQLPSEYNGKKVTSIGTNVFWGSKNITGMIIPEGITSIGTRAFYGCEKLVNIKIPKSVTTVLEEAFENTPWLEAKRAADPLVVVNNILIDGKSAKGNVTIPNGVTYISEGSFKKNNNITSVTMPSSVKTIGNNAFDSCKALNKVVLSDNITSIGIGAFYRCAFSEIKLPSSLKKIQEFTFGECVNLKEIDIPNGVQEIKDGAFDYCTGLTSVNISNSVKEIRYRAFAETHSLVKITIPENVVKIGQRAFDNSKIESVTIKNSACVIYDEALTLPTSAAIWGYSNSTAQAYAKKYSRNFIDMGLLKGDANRDGVVRASDAAFIARKLAEASIWGEILTVEKYPNADFNGDGKVTAADAAAIAKYLAEQSIKK